MLNFIRSEVQSRRDSFIGGIFVGLDCGLVCPKPDQKGSHTEGSLLFLIHFLILHFIFIIITGYFYDHDHEHIF